MAFGGAVVDPCCAPVAPVIGPGIAAIVVIILLLIALGIIFPVRGC